MLRMLMILLTTLSLSLSFHSNALSVQTSEQQQFTALLVSLYEQMTAQDNVEKRLSYDLLFSGECAYPTDLTSDGDILREKSRLLRKDTGLELRGGYNTDSFSNNDSTDEGFDSGRGNLELSWDLLKEGYLQNSSRAETSELQASEADLLSDYEEIENSFRCRRLEIKKQFGTLFAGALEKELRLLEPVYQVERRAYFKQWSYLDDYLVSEQDLLQTRQELALLSSDPFFDDAPYHASLPPIITIDLPRLLEKVRQDDSLASLYALQKQRLEAEEASDYQDSFRVYVRQEFGVNSSSGNQDNLIAGLRFRVPLHTRENNLRSLQLRKLERNKDFYLWERIAQCRSVYNELQEQLNRAINQQYRHERAEERLRRTLESLKRGDTSLLTTAITRMKTFIEAEVERIRAVELLYSKTNDVLRAANIPYQPDLIQEVDLKKQLVRARPGKRSIYIWSSDLHALSNDDIVTFLKAKNITTVLLSAGKQPDIKKRDDLIRMMEHLNIAVEVIAGDNSWIFPEKQQGAIEKSLVEAEVTGYLHFDIEPQAMAGYQQNREKYLVLYTELVRTIKAGLIDRNLSVAVPFHWPDQTYRDLADIADRIYVMAYGTTRVDTMVRRIERIRAVVPVDKLVVVLNAKEFVDEWTMEKMIEDIIAQTDVRMFGIHDLGNFFRIIQKTDTSP